MSWLSDLLTGKEPSLETRSLSTISDEQRAQLNAMLTQLGAKGPTDPNSMVAPLTSAERSSLAALEERSKALALPDTTGAAARNSVEQLLDFEGQTADVNDYFTNAVQNPMVDAFQRDILPKISRQFGGADFFSSERQASEGLARQDLLNSLTAQRSTVALDQFNKSRDRALQAAGLLPNLNQADAIRTQEQAGILEALGLPRQIDQAGIDKAVAEDARLQELLAQLSLTPTIENIGMTNPGNAGLINIILGGAANGLGDSLGGLFGNGGSFDLGSLLGGLFDGDKENPSGESPADGMPPSDTGTTVRDIPPVVGGVGGTTTTPGGQVTITEGQNGQQAAQQPAKQPGGINIGPMAGGLGGAIAGSIGADLLTRGGSAIITEAGGQLAAQVGSSGAGAAAGSAAAGEAAGAAAGAPAGSGSSIAGAASTALAWAGALYGAYNTYEAAAVGDKKNAVMSGAATGAAIGSVIPVIGTAVGAVVGAIVGLVGASFGDKQQASEAFYGSYKKVPTEQVIRNWNADQVNGAMFETIKSHTKSGNVNRFKDVSEMFTAFGITRDAHKNYRNVQDQMKGFIDGVIRTAQQAGGLPTDPKELAKLDGQQIYEKIVKPAMAAKIEEVTGTPADQTAWSPNYKGEKAGIMQNLFADYTDWLTSHWGQDPSTINKSQATPRAPGGGNTRVPRER